MANDLFERISKIRAFVFDVDGVMTDGRLLLLEDGEWLRTMNMKDGFALKHAVGLRYRIGVISGSGSEAINYRLNALGIKQVFMHIESKLSALEKFVIENEIPIAEILYMGDDIPDLPCLKAAGLAACPQDAVAEVKAASHYIAEAKGGDACVREVIELVLKAQGNWKF